MKYRELINIGVITVVTVLWLYTDYILYAENTTYWHYFHPIFYLIYLPLTFGVVLALSDLITFIRSHSRGSMKNHFMVGTVVLPFSWLFMLPVLFLYHTEPAVTLILSPPLPGDLPYVLYASIALQILAIIAVLIPISSRSTTFSS
jgi:hypothetical protein